MASLINAVATTKKVQNNIEMFESLSLTKNRDASDTNTVRPSPVVELDHEVQSTPLLTAVSSKPVNNNGPQPKPMSSSTVRSSHKRHDSTAFVEKSYLQHANSSLIDDAKEILKSQPGLDEVEAVLSYIQYGIEGQHDFNIKVTNAKASMLVHVLATTTLPDLWPNLGLTKLSKADIRIKNTLLAALFSVTGLEVIIEQMRRRTSKSFSANTAHDVYVDFLGTMLSPSDTILRLLQDSRKLYTKEVQHRLFWQSIVTLIGGGKVLSTVASVVKNGPDTTSWLSDGSRYSQWLGRNIVEAAIEIMASDVNSWTNLSQLLKRGLNLGYKGETSRTLANTHTNIPQKL